MWVDWEQTPWQGSVCENGVCPAPTPIPAPTPALPQPAPAPTPARPQQAARRIVEDGDSESGDGDSERDASEDVKGK
jgi:hypothetical protein